MTQVHVEEHMGLALRLARRRRRMHDVMPREDYEQEAFLALVVAAEKYDSTKGAKFSTFAFHRISGALINAEREWLNYNRRLRTGPTFSELRPEHDRPFEGMSNAAAEALPLLFPGTWFSRLARLHLFGGMTPYEVAQLAGCTVNAVHKAVSTWRQAFVAEHCL